MKFTALGVVRQGRLQVEGRAAFEAAFRKWPDGPVWVTIQDALIFRSPAQNAHWHACVVHPLAAAAGVSPKAMNEALKVLLLPEVVPVPRQGAEALLITVGQSTTALTRPEAANLIERGELLAEPFQVAAVTHFLPWDHPTITRHRKRALCGALVDLAMHRAHPSCPACIKALGGDEVPF